MMAAVNPLQGQLLVIQYAMVAGAGLGILSRKMRQSVPMMISFSMEAEEEKLNCPPRTSSAKGDAMEDSWLMAR